jgi:hypothetical protein
MPIPKVLVFADVACIALNLAQEMVDAGYGP